MRINKALLLMIPLLSLLGCSNNDEVIVELPPIPHSISMVAKDYMKRNVYTTLVQDINYCLSIKADGAPMKYEDIKFVYNDEYFTLTPMHPYQYGENCYEYFFLCTAKQSFGSASLSVNYYDVIDTKTYSFTDTTISSSLMNITPGLASQEYDGVFYFSSYETYCAYDSKYNINKISFFNEAYFTYHDLALANVCHRSYTKSVEYQKAFVDGNTLNIAFNFIEDYKGFFDVLLRTYYVQLEKLTNVTGASVFISNYYI